MFNLISTELNINGNMLEILDNYFEYEYKNRTILETAYDSQYKDYRDINENEKQKVLPTNLGNKLYITNWKN